MAFSAAVCRQHIHYLNILRDARSGQAEELAQLDDIFPHDADPVVARRWLLHAVESGRMWSIVWRLARKVNTAFRQSDSDTVLHVALNRKRTDRPALLALLWQAGADVKLKGGNDWTPAHGTWIRVFFNIRRSAASTG